MIKCPNCGKEVNAVVQCPDCNKEYCAYCSEHPVNMICPHCGSKTPPKIRW